jgi:hypothetical protein
LQAAEPPVLGVPPVTPAASMLASHGPDPQLGELSPCLLTCHPVFSSKRDRSTIPLGGFPDEGRYYS